jgi:hypothetical protein
MKQITDTVNNFLALIVGIGLICFASFVFLLASAKLSDSTLGTLLARSAGETARMARTESFAFWGQVSSEVAAGLGAAREPLSTGISPSFTPVVIVATPSPVSTSSPPATAVPTTYVRSTPFSEGGLLLWRGLDANSQPLSSGVNLEQLQQQVSFALSQNAGDLLALWLQKKVNECRPFYDAIVKANYQDASQAGAIRAAAQSLKQCNPRIYAAYANERWADLSAWTSQTPIDESQAAQLLDGLSISIGAKVDGPARAIRPEDSVQVTVQALPEYGLVSRTFILRVSTLNQLLGSVDEGKWSLNSGPYKVGAGSLYPASPAEPVLPTEADLTPPVAAAAQNAAVAASAACAGTYVVQTGDTVYSIARKCGVSPADLIAANPDTLGLNPNYIVPGQSLNIPASTP